MNLPSRFSPVRASSVAMTVAWLVAVAALILLSLQLPNGTAPHQATGSGPASGRSSSQG
ncbi:MAG TPA: hypothetical protein VFE07_03985 [Marmoricola sp.]|jgi:hypothetical protein|nr:hypothetical protein [Marmoricola sp.]